MYQEQIYFSNNNILFQAIHEDAMQTFATRLKMHLESLVDEESIEEEGSVRYLY